jgi:recombination protein RecA
LNDCSNTCSQLHCCDPSGFSRLGLSQAITTVTDTSQEHTNHRRDHRDRHRQQEYPVDKNKSLDMAMSQIDKQFGKGSVMKMGERTNLDIGTVPTGALALDLALGVGGLPRGRVVEIFGPESSGKSTLATHVVAEAQRNGGICAFVDAEHAMDPVYAKAIGVDVDELLISQPDTGEQALEIADMLIRSGALDVVVIDSVAALTPRAEIEGEMGDTHVGLQARLMSQALRKLTANLSKSKTVCIFINQLREKIGVMFGSPETTPGGRALKFYSSTRLDIRRIESLKDGVEVVGNRTRVKVVKNKCAAPFKKAEFDIMYSKGISREGSVLDLGVELELVKKSGAWYTYEGEQLGQGRENAKEFLVENPEVMVEISELVRTQLGLNGDPSEADGEGEEVDDTGEVDETDVLVLDPDDQPITLD